METKICFKCSEEKPLADFYTHPKMPDGYLNKCKKCAISEAREREKLNRLIPSWCEKERERHREKYQRLNYKEKQKQWDENRPWKKSFIYKNLHRDNKLTKDQAIHHWNYNLLNDYFILSKKDHKLIHMHLIFDENSRCFMYNNQILDTKEKHKKVIDNLIQDK